MTIEEHIECARAAAAEALRTPPLIAAREFLRAEGADTSAILRQMDEIARTQAIPPIVDGWQMHFRESNPDTELQAALPRLLLLTAARETLGAIPSLPVDDSVKHLICKEFRAYANPPAGAAARFMPGQYSFLAMCKIAMLERFPAGQLHWEVSGLPRKWLTRVPAPQLSRVLYALATGVKGFSPCFVTHVGGTVQRLPLLTEREHRKSFLRAALAIAKQPEIKGLLAGSWLHSRETHRVSPHLSFMNVPYLEAGGISFDAGPAESDGFLDGDPRRAEMYRSGEYRPTFGVVLCSRRQLLRWAADHRDLASSLGVLR